MFLNGLIEAASKPAAAAEWKISRGPLFNDSVQSLIRTYPDLAEKLSKFWTVKKDNPLSSPYGKHDRPMTGPLTGLWHCHLHANAVLIYCLRNHCVHLVAVLPHSDLEGKRLKNTAMRLKSAGEMAEAIVNSVLPALFEGKTNYDLEVNALHPDHVTDTQSFKSWFTGSKVIDRHGNPLKMFHGTGDVFTEFHAGSHFGTSRAANQRAGYRQRALNGTSSNVVPVYLRITNPLRVNDQQSSDQAALHRCIVRGDFPDIDVDISWKQGAYKAAQDAGYDGLVYRNDMEDRGKLSWVIFNPNQAKSAISNTDFTDSPHISEAISQVKKLFDFNNKKNIHEMKKNTAPGRYGEMEMWTVNTSREIDSLLARFRVVRAMLHPDSLSVWEAADYTHGDYEEHWGEGINLMISLDYKIEIYDDVDPKSIRANPVFTKVFKGKKVTFLNNETQEIISEKISSTGRLDHSARDFGLWLTRLDADAAYRGVKNYDYDDIKNQALRYRIMVTSQYRNFIKSISQQIADMGWHLTFELRRGKLWQLVFEPIVAPRTPKNGFFWHVTPQSNSDTIVHDGLVPSSSRFAISYPQPRVYLFRNQSDARQMVDVLTKKDKKPTRYSLIRVDMTKAKSVKLHIDPEISKVAVYTTNPIPASACTLAATVVEDAPSVAELPDESNPSLARCTTVTCNAILAHFSKPLIRSAGEMPRTGRDVLNLLQRRGLRYSPENMMPPQTVKTFVMQHQTGTYYIGTMGHAMAVIDGELFDAERKGLDGRMVQIAAEIIR